MTSLIGFLSTGGRSTPLPKEVIKHDIQIPLIVPLAKGDITNDIDVIHVIIKFKIYLFIYCKYTLTAFISWQGFITQHLFFLLLLRLLINNSKAKYDVSNFFYNATCSIYFLEYIIIQSFLFLLIAWCLIVFYFPFYKTENFLAELRLWWYVLPNVKYVQNIYYFISVEIKNSKCDSIELQFIVIIK